MENIRPICTCGDTACPFHPTNHNQGCAPCIAKNQRMREVPSCLFHMVEGEKDAPHGYTFEDFARLVLAAKQREPEEPRGCGHTPRLP